MSDAEVRTFDESVNDAEHSDIRHEHYSPDSDDSFEIMTESNIVHSDTKRESGSVSTTSTYEKDALIHAEPNKAKSLSPTEIEVNVKRISSVMSAETSADVQDFEESLDDILDLYDFSQAFQGQTGELLNKYGITGKLVELLEKSNMLQDDQDYYKVHLPALNICFKYSDASPAFAMELANRGVIESLTKCLKYESLATESRSHNDYIRMYIGILHNIVVDTSRHKHLFLAARTLQTLKKYIDHEDDDIRLTAVLTISYIISGQDLKLVKNLPDNVVPQCLEWLKEAVANRKRTSRSGFHLWTLVLGLANLSVIEEIHKELTSKDSLKFLREVMKMALDDKERYACEKLFDAIDIKGTEREDQKDVCERRVMTISQRSQTLENTKKTSQRTQTCDSDVNTTQCNQPLESSEVSSQCAHNLYDDDPMLQHEQNKEQQKTTANKESISISQKQLKELDLLLVGKTGYGKSAAGNTIVGKKVFKSISSSTSVTKDVTYTIVNFEDYVVKVVDGPGVADTSDTKDIKNTSKLIIDKMGDAIILSPDGYHAFLLVIKYGNRLTAEDHLSVDLLKQIFGQDFVKTYCILLVNGGDQFKEENPNLSFKDWCQEQTGVFQNLLAECNNRAVMFDNKSRYSSVRIEQMQVLIRVVESLPSGGQRYTDDRFQKVAADRNRLLLEAKEPMIREETLKQVSHIIQNVEEVSKLEDNEQIDELDKLKSQAEEIQREVNGRDQGTGVLKHAIQTTETLMKTIENKIDSLKMLIAEKEKFKLLQEELAQKEEQLKRGNREAIQHYEKEITHVIEMNKMQEEKLKSESERLSKEFEKREKEMRQAIENKRKDAADLKNKIKLLEDRLKDSSIEADQRKKHEKKKEFLMKKLENLSAKIESDERNLAELITKERIKAKQHFEKEMDIMKKKLQMAVETHDTKVKEMTEREKRLIKDFETQKESLSTRFLLAAKGLVDFKNMEQKENLLQLCNLFEEMQNDYVKTEKAKAKEKKSFCSPS